MKHVLLCLVFFSLSLSLSAQEEKLEVKSVIELFFKGLNSKDTAVVKSSLYAGSRLETVVEKGEVQVQEVDVEEFLKQLARAGDARFEEVILSYDIHVDDQMAQAWLPYEFYNEGKMSHCGVNMFTLVRLAEGWKIHHIIDTRRKDCD